MKARIPLLSLTSTICFFILWEAIVRFGLAPAALPSPSGVLYALYEVSGTLPTHVAHSLLHFAAGYLSAATVAIPLGMLAGWYAPARKALEPIIEFFRPIPPIAWIPFALLAFAGYFEASAFIIFVGAFFPLFTNTYTGFRDTPVSYVEVVKSLGADQLQILRRVALPSALPQIFTGIRIALGVGWMCVIAAEMFVPYGLGWAIIQMRYLHDIRAVMAYMFIIGALGFAMERTAKLIELKLFRWQRGLVVGV
ncbi:MAG: ABC transporter permease [Candidatus Hecatellales archaeon]|nr:MAG: ABC transporter permease [Candidatus Hecatellales archaeon]